MLDQLFDIIDGRAAALGDAHLARSVDDDVILALRLRHRIDDRLGLLQLAFHLGGHFRRQLRHHAAEHIPRQQFKDALQRADLFYLSQLIAEIFERERIARQLLFQRRRLVFIHLGLDFFDQRQHVAHAQNARDDAIRIKRIERIVLFADADKLDRLADDCLDRERRAAARIAIHLGQDDARNADAFVELVRALDRVLPGHCVGDKQRFNRLHLRLDALQLIHQRIVNVQPARRVNHQRVEADLLAMQPRRPAQFQRIVNARAVKDRNANRLADDRQLIARRRAVNVHRQQQRIAVLIGRQPPRQLAGRSRLARSLQPHDHHRVGPPRSEQQPARSAAQHLDHLVVDDLDDLLPRRQ